MYYAYILRCADGTFYAGYAADIEKRVQLHQSGKAAKYTRGRLPVALVHCEPFETKREAMRRECQIKRMTRIQKERLLDAQHPPLERAQPQTSEQQATD